MSDKEILALSYNKPSAFGVLFDRYQRLFTASARKDSLSGDEIEDIVQETFVRIYKYGNSILKSDGNFKPWAYKILRNAINDHVTNKKMAIPIDEFIENTHGSNTDWVDYESADYVQSILNNLDPLSAKILKMKYIFGKTTKQISRILGINDGAIRVKIHRARKNFVEIHKKLNT